MLQAERMLPGQTKLLCTCRFGLWTKGRELCSSLWP
jgi:hypothetical protein